MKIITLATLPNQSFTFTIDNVRWGMVVKEAAGVMVVDIARDGVPLLTGTRALAGEALIPYRYLETANFIFVTIADALPDWRQFGASQTLVYVTEAEIAALPQITVGEILAMTSKVEYIFTDDGLYITTDDGSLIQQG